MRFSMRSASQSKTCSIDFSLPRVREKTSSNWSKTSTGVRGKLSVLQNSASLRCRYSHKLSYPSVFGIFRLCAFQRLPETLPHLFQGWVFDTLREIQTHQDGKI